MRHKIVALTGTGSRPERVTALDIASLKRGEIIKFVRSATTMKAVVFVNGMETGGKGVDLLIGGLAMNLRSQKVVLHFKDQMVEILKLDGEICLISNSFISPSLSGAFLLL